MCGDRPLKDLLLLKAIRTHRLEPNDVLRELSFNACDRSLLRRNGRCLR